MPNLFRQLLLRFVLCALGACPALRAQAPDPSPGNAALRTVDRIEYDLPLYDAPLSGDIGYAFPSMTQSLAITRGLAQGTHWTMARFTDRKDSGREARFLGSLGAMLAEVALVTLPGGYSWLHEEWHRAVLTRRGIGSYNGIYDFRILSSAVPVSRVRDEDLVRLKRAYPADMVRLAAAGNEAQIELARSLRRELFFNRRECSLDWITLFINAFSPASYVFLCSMPYADRLTDQLQRAEGTDIAKRDILGMDFTAWVYDLHRPGEPYDSGRGVHPSGVGINRYIKRAQLTKEEKDYLQLQGFLAWLNLVNPQLAMKNRFTGRNPFTKEPLYWNAALVHHLTPFGFAVDCDVMARTRSAGVAATLHSFFNRHRWYPGASIEADDVPVPLFRSGGAFPRLFLSGKAEGWFQPKTLRFDESAPAAGGALSACLKAAVARNLLVSLSGAGKSAGWQAGRVSLEKEWSASLGLSLWLPNRIPEPPDTASPENR